MYAYMSDSSLSFRCSFFLAQFIGRVFPARHNLLSQTFRNPMCDRSLLVIYPFLIVLDHLDSSSNTFSQKDQKNGLR